MAGCHAESKATLMSMKAQAVYFFLQSCFRSWWRGRVLLTQSIYFLETMLAIVEPVVLRGEPFETVEDYFLKNFCSWWLNTYWTGFVGSSVIGFVWFLYYSDFGGFPWVGKWLTRRAVAVCNSSTEKGGVGEWLFKLLETEEIILLCWGLEGGSGLKKYLANSVASCRVLLENLLDE